MRKPASSSPPSPLAPPSSCSARLGYEATSAAFVTVTILYLAAARSHAAGPAVEEALRAELRPDGGTSAVSAVAPGGIRDRR
ncbi:MULTISPECIES: hypothetical protein [unclassified Streptomyces]|uniref:hypothetical protein n=1 Tax=unclassified Streptomyces TaxID=2593676 RepID=UPI003318807B